MTQLRCINVAFIPAFLFVCLTLVSDLSAADLVQTTGNITYLRADAVPGAWGSGSDRIEAEIFIWLDNKPGMTFGFQLRDNNDDTALREAMFELLLQAYRNNWPVAINYWIETGQQNGIIHRVWVSRQ